MQGVGMILPMDRLFTLMDRSPPGKFPDHKIGATKDFLDVIPR